MANAPGYKDWYTNDYLDLSKLTDPELQNQIQIARNGKLNPITSSDALQAEVAKRQVASQNSSNESFLQNLLGGSGGGSSGGFEGDVRNANSQRMQQLNDIFSNQLASGKEQINNNYADQERRAIAEQAATGNYRAPIGNSPSGALGQIRSAKDAAMNELIRGNTVGRAQQQYGSESQGLSDILQARSQDAAQRGQLASLGLQSRQFGNNFGLENQKFGFQVSQAEQQRQMQERQYALADILGRQQAEAAKPSTFGQIASVVGGLGSLAGGAGALYGGLGAYRQGNAMASIFGGK